MGVCFIHTADWQIGKLFANLPDSARSALTEQRIETVKNIGELADSVYADAVLVAGDVFETAAVSDQTLRRTLIALESFSGVWILLPGNHDAALAESPWTRIRRLQDLPDNVILATAREPVVLADRRATVFPAPLQRRHEVDDLTAWFDTAPSAEDSIRIGLAHGSVEGFLPEAADAPNPIAHDRAERARLDYLALGDWHGTLKVGPRTWYSGTPEPDRFKANDPGNVLIVRIDAPGAPPSVEKRNIGRYRWYQHRLTVHGDADIDDAATAVAGLDDELERAVVSLKIAGTVDLGRRERLSSVLNDIEARVRHLRVDDDHLVAEPSDDDLDQIDQLGFVRTAIDRLRTRANDPADPERGSAKLALQILYSEHNKAG